MGILPLMAIITALLSRFTWVINRILLLIYYLTAKRFKIIGQSMEPIINEGEQVFITKMYYKFNKIKRNDIIGLYNNQKNRDKANNRHAKR